MSLFDRNLKNLTRAFIAIYALGLFVPVMNVDAAQYAELSRELLHSADWLQLHIRGAEYLDKPPLLFWLSALSFKIFGIHYWSYKLPSYLFFILAAYSIRRIGTKLYNERTGELSALMFVSSFCGMLMVNDVRTDTILVGSFSFVIWQLLEFQENSKWKYFFGAFTGIGVSMLVKGPMGIVFPALIFFIHHAYKREWRKIFRWQWIAGIALVALILLPMSIGLYEQFDLHPERSVNEHTGVSGLRFYYWTQSFGRLTGDSDWGTKYNNGSTPFFFTHTFLWSFAPWCLLTIGGVILQLKKMIAGKFSGNAVTEVITVTGFVMTFLVISLSKYRLPHYVYVTFPFAALLAARFYQEAIEGKGFIRMKMLAWLNFIVTICIAAVGFLVLLRFFPMRNYTPAILLSALLLFTVICFFRTKELSSKVFMPMLIMLQMFYVIMLYDFYPSLIKYDSGTTLGKILAQQPQRNEPVYIFETDYDYTFDFNARLRNTAGTLHWNSGSMDDLKGVDSCYILTDEEHYKQLKSSSLKIIHVWSADHFRVQFLTMPFLEPTTRASRLQRRYLLYVSVPKLIPGSPPAHS
jgi:4-amino-4-deoxy-L-arabinose transferase-like glycosyltransferase